MIPEATKVDQADWDPRSEPYSNIIEASELKIPPSPICTLMSSTRAFDSSFLLFSTMQQLFFHHLSATHNNKLKHNGKSPEDSSLWQRDVLLFNLYVVGILCLCHCLQLNSSIINVEDLLGECESVQFTLMTFKQNSKVPGNIICVRFTRIELYYMHGKGA